MMAAGSSCRFRALRWTAGGLFVAFLAIQFIRPQLTNPPVTAELQTSPEVKEILKTSCYSCHSNETKLPWFDQIAPAYWIVVKDVNDGRKQLNFSEIGRLPAAQQRGILFEAVSNIQMGVMPLPSYLRVHPHAAVTAEQLAVLKAYLSPPAMATAAATDTADADYSNWIHAGDVSAHVHPAPNGIAFLRDYKNWKTISSTERFDNNSMREILGNDVAVKAIAEDQIHPWPDGTVFAKVAWLDQPDGKGLVRTGAFYQVEFMIRDSKKYASTLGWGWARWRGADLKPYGKDASFTGECVNCHRPLRSTNYVFTSPIGGQQ
jgi:hypothetical protein